jgi:hypothetical protein
MAHILPAAVTAIGIISGLTWTNYLSNREVQIVNHSNRAILEFYKSNGVENAWGPDLLGSSILAPGDFDLNDGTGDCRFDFLTVMEDGRRLIRPRVNICEVGSYTIE